MPQTAPERKSLLRRLAAAGFACLPHHWLSRVVYWASRRRTRLKNPVKRWFIRRYGVDMEEALEPEPTAYPDFNAFFTRALRRGVRPLEGGPDEPVSPVDGRVSQAGRIRDSRLYQAKGVDYTLAALLGDTGPDVDAFRDGWFATLYLAPGDYHRIHMPLGGRPHRMCHVPGRLYSVAPWTVATIPGLFARNERVVTWFDTAKGPLALVLVGAMNVAAIETVWHGLVTPPTRGGVHCRGYGADAAPIPRGEEMGRFNMGSTVIVITPPAIELDRVPTAGSKIRLGQRIGTLQS